MTEPATGETTEQLIDAAWSAGHPVTPAQIIRYQQHGALWPPHQLSRGKGGGKGKVTIYAPGSAAQLVALRELLETNRDLDAVAWALWWQGFPIPERTIRLILTRLLDRADEFRNMARYLGQDDYSVDDAIVDRAWATFDKYASRLVGRSLKHLARQYGFNDPRDLLRILAHVLDGEVPEPFKPDSGVTVSALTATEGKGPTGLDLMFVWHLYAQKVNAVRLRNALALASAEELDLARDLWRALAFMFEGVAQLFFRRVAGPFYDDTPLGTMLVEAPGLNQFVFLVVLANQRDPSFGDGLRSFAAAVKTPETQRWLHQE